MTTILQITDTHIVLKARWCRAGSTPADALARWLPGSSHPLPDRPIDALLVSWRSER